MNNKLFILCSCVCFLAFSVGVVAAKKVAFEVRKIRTTQGDLHYQIFDCENEKIELWDKLRLIASGVVVPENEEIIIEVQLPTSDINCIRIFQDVNGSRILEFSESGIPKEPVGFSDNPSLMLGYPKPQDTAISLSQKNNSLLSIKMNYRRKN